MTKTTSNRWDLKELGEMLVAKAGQAIQRAAQSSAEKHDEAFAPSWSAEDRERISSEIDEIIEEREEIDLIIDDSLRIKDNKSMKRKKKYTEKEVQALIEEAEKKAALEAWRQALEISLSSHNGSLAVELLLRDHPLSKEFQEISKRLRKNAANDREMKETGIKIGEAEGAPSDEEFLRRFEEFKNAKF